MCVGEKAEERGGEQTAMVLRRQLLQLVRVLGRDLASIVIAYEPVWAIGSGDAATPGMIDHIHGFIADTLAFQSGLSSSAARILYGGSVNPRNAQAILSRSAVALLHADGSLRGYRGCARDVTQSLEAKMQLWRRDEALRLAKERAEASSQAKGGPRAQPRSRRPVGTWSTCWTC